MLDRLKLSEEEYLQLKLDEIDADQIYNSCHWGDPEFVRACLEQGPQQLAQRDDPFLQLVVNLYPEYVRLRELNKAREGELNKLYGELVTIKQGFQQQRFIPDANGTLRLTFGVVRGYSPEDAILMLPTTTLGGVVAKTTGSAPFVTPPKILDLHAHGDFGRYAHPQLNDVPVALLYDTDTTGGNSGSPVLNAHGELVGVNFDRAFEATINDFAWNTNYSRSIGVDIRYVLWITDNVFNAQNLIKEMGLQ